MLYIYIENIVYWCLLMAFIFTRLPYKNSVCSSPTIPCREFRPVTTRTNMPPTNNLSRTWRLESHGMDFLQVPFLHLLVFFFEIPQGCNVWIKRQNGKPKKKNVPCLFEGFRSLIGFHHFCWIFWFPSHPCIVKPFAELKSNWIISPKNRCKTFKIFEPNTFKFGLTDIHLMPVLPCLLKIASQDTQSWHRRNCNNWRSKCSSVPPCRSCQGWNLAYADNLGSPEGGLINRVDGRGAMIPWSPVQNELCCRQNWREVGQLG